MSVRATHVAHPDVVVVPIEGDRLTISLSWAARTERTHDEAALWERMCEQNPALFDGQILAVTHVHHESNTGDVAVCARIDRYSTLCIERHRSVGATGSFDTPACAILSVTAMLTRPAPADPSRIEVLLGLRSGSVASYPMHWEFGPAGGVHAPAENQTHISIDALRDVVVEEFAEEIEAPSQRVRRSLLESRVIALVYDAVALSYDVVLHAPVAQGSLADHLLLGGSAASSVLGRWEYQRLAWVPTDQIERFFRTSDHPAIPPTIALARACGWAL